MRQDHVDDVARGIAARINSKPKGGPWTFALASRPTVETDLKSWVQLVTGKTQLPIKVTLRKCLPQVEKAVNRLLKFKVFLHAMDNGDLGVSRDWPTTYNWLHVQPKDLPRQPGAIVNSPLVLIPKFELPRVPRCRLCGNTLPKRSRA